MIISNVKITNFRCYYGTSSITLNSNNKITLIYGDSGFGKSSFLQFFRWMFYNDPDFGDKNDKPLFNIIAYQECAIGKPVVVSGQIDFSHLGTQYRLNKSQEWSTTIKMENSRLEKTDYSLTTMGEDGSYHPVPDVANIINTILPKGLSKYFLLDGERAREIVLDSNELREAIYSLFGLDSYTEAISHIGNKSAKNSVLGHYHSLLASNIVQTNLNGMSTADLQEIIQDLYAEIENMKNDRRQVMADTYKLNIRRDEIFKTLGTVSSKSNIEQLVKRNEQVIKQNEEKIIYIRHKIGNLFYANYPYLFLAKVTSKSSCMLRKKNAEFAANYQNIFENLKKDLLKEIINKNMCICGRELDDDTKKHIENIIDAMPPNSYTYQFSQFVAKAKNQIRLSRNNLMEYEAYLTQIASCENEITKYEDENKEKLEELKRLDDAADLVKELEKIDLAIDENNKKKEGYEGNIAKKKQLYSISENKLNNILKNSKVSGEYSAKITFFDDVLKILKLEKEGKELQVKTTINSCVKEVFKKLTTQIELDVDKIQFVNDDFSLRTTYLTGGQLAVDVYSYVIGIIKALQECKMENNENPIIIDAPFAFTGNAQSEHLFKTLPTVSRQTVLLTLDLNKIKNLLKESDLYDFYVIKNDSQDKATIERGDINGFKF